MSIGVYGLLIVFGAFIILLIINPNLSCFGKRIKSPFYPLLRKRKGSTYRAKHAAHPSAAAPGDASAAAKKPSKPTEDYGFHLDDKS